MNWKTRVGAVLTMAVTVYAATAFVSNVLASNSRSGCDRGNSVREQLYKGNVSTIKTDQAVIAAVRVGPNVDRVRIAMTRDINRAHAANIALTQNANDAYPWAVNCPDAYPAPLPWFGS